MSSFVPPFSIKSERRVEGQHDAVPRPFKHGGTHSKSTNRRVVDDDMIANAPHNDEVVAVNVSNQRHGDIR